MKTRAKNYCTAQNLQAALKMTDEEKREAFVCKDIKKINRAIMLAHNAGMIVVPPCDNVDGRGMCQGHEVK